MDRATRATRSDEAVRVRRVRAADIAAVAALDARVTRIAKPGYWNDVFRRYGKRRLHERFFLVAEDRTERTQPKIVGFIVGEVRAWEFGSAPCGWIFALSVDPEARLLGIGRGMLAAIAGEFRKAGISKIRTVVARNDQLPMMFFRSEGMTAGPYIQLEKDIA